MTGERWPDKRARAVLFAGAKKHVADEAEAERRATLGLQLRDLLFVDGEVREENADPSANRIGYSRDCMQFALIEPGDDGLIASLWIGTERRDEAKSALGGTDDPNPFRALYGWVRVSVQRDDQVAALKPWITQAVEHATTTKQQQAATKKR